MTRSVLGAKVRRDLLRRRVRTALSILGIVIGVAGLVAVSATARQLTAAQRSLVGGPGYPDLLVRTEAVSPRLAPLVARQLDASVVEARLRVETTFSAGGPFRGASLAAFPADTSPTLAAPRVVEGRMPARGEVAFDASVTALAPVALGDTVTVRERVGAPRTTLTVVGFTRTPAALDAGILNRALGYVGEDQAVSLLGDAGVNQLLVKLAPGADATVASDRLAGLLDRRGVIRGPVVSREGALVGTRELETLVWLLLAFSVLGLGLSGVLIGNTVAATVQDEAPQIGVLKALGATRRRTVLTYLAPTVVLAVVGATVGYLLGLAGAQAIVGSLTSLLGYPRPSLTVTWREIGLAAVVGLGVPVVAAIGPTLLVARLPVVALLRTHGLGGGTARRVGWASRALGRRPLLALATRNAARRRLRSGMTVGLIAVAVAAAIAAQGLSSSLDATVDDLYAVYGADAWIGFERAVDAAVVDAVAREPGVVAAEAWGRESGHIGDTAVDLWAVPPSTEVYRYRLTAGHWLDCQRTRTVVASDRLARARGLDVGDMVRLDIGEETRPVEIVGLVDDESTSLGSTEAGKLFLSLETLASFGGASGFRVVAVSLDRHDPAGVEARLETLGERLAALGPSPYPAYSDKEATERTVEILVALLGAMVALVALTGTVGVVNTLAINVAERRREVGVARALGASRRHVATLVAGEAATLGLAGYLAGVALGLPLAVLLVRLTGDVLFRMTFSLPPSFLLLALGVTLVACTLAAVGPAAIATRVRPASVLRYE